MRSLRTAEPPLILPGKLPLHLLPIPRQPLRILRQQIPPLHQLRARRRVLLAVLLEAAVALLDRLPRVAGLLPVRPRLRERDVRAEQAGELPVGARLLAAEVP